MMFHLEEKKSMLGTGLKTLYPEMNHLQTSHVAAHMRLQPISPFN